MPTVFAQILAAAPPSTWEQIKRVPKETWINIAICLIAVVAIVCVWRALKNINDYAPYVDAALAPH